MSAGTESLPGRILVVCTGNVCRSPYIERVMAARLIDTGIEVSSAGTGALVGNPMESQAEKRLVRAGADPAGFVARQLTQHMVREADLVLCATRQHRSVVVRAEPKGLRYTHTLADFSDLAQVMLDSEPAWIEPAGNLIRALAGAANLHRDRVLPRPPERADLIDPYRQPDAAFDRMVDQVETHLAPVVNLLNQASRHRRTAKRE